MTTARPILGRGLDALIQRAQTERTPEDDLPRRLPIDLIDPNPEQPRSTIDPETLQELADSLRAVGVLQPLLITPGAGERYTLVAGERRLRAARLAGLQEVPVIVTSLAGDELLTAALVENVQREDLSPLEEARAYERLIEATGESQSQIAQRVGKSRSAVANALRLLGLSSAIRDSLASREISEGHARALLAVTDPGAQEQLWRRVVREGLNVRQTERAAQASKLSGAIPAGAPVSKAALPDSVLASDDAVLAGEMEAALGTRVRVHRGDRGGRLEIHWYDDEHLQHLAGRVIAAHADAPVAPPDHLTI